MAKFMRLIYFSTITAILMYTYCGCNIVSAYAINYNNTKIGYIPIETSAEVESSDVENRVNSKIADGDVDIKKNLEIIPAVCQIKKTENTVKVANKVLNSTTKQFYCLKINGTRYSVVDTKQEITDYLSHLINYACLKYDTSEAAITVGYDISYEYLISGAEKHTDDEMLEILGIKASKTVTETEYEEIPFDTTRRYGNKNGIILQKGVVGTLEKQYAVTYVNNAVVNKEFTSSDVVTAPVNQIVTTNVYNELPENTLACDASILGLDAEKTEFINTILPIAVDGYHATGILPSLTMAQAILESGFGKSPIGNNIYGIKAGSDWNGKTRYVWTKEQLEDGTYIDIKAHFKDYASFGDSVRDYLKLLSGDRYSKVRVSHNYFDAACAVQKAGYATSLSYAKNLVNVIEKYKLYKWDKVDAQINHAPIIVPIEK